MKRKKSLRRKKKSPRKKKRSENMSQPPYTDQPHQEPQQQYPPQAPPEKKPKSKVASLVAVVVIVAIIIGLAVGLSLASSHATLKVKIISGHFFSTVSYELYIDGALQKTGTLAPGQNAEYTFDMYPGWECRNYNVVVTYTGGGFGSQSDTEDVRLCAGETKVVTIHG